MKKTKGALKQMFGLQEEHLEEMAAHGELGAAGVAGPAAEVQAVAPNGIGVLNQVDNELPPCRA